MTAETYRARWIDRWGRVKLDERFEYDVSAHESARFMAPYAHVGLALDAPYFDLRELQAHVGGYIETALVDENTFAIVNEEGLLLGFHPAPHPAVTQASVSYGQPLVGAVVLVNRER